MTLRLPAGPPRPHLPGQGPRRHPQGRHRRPPCHGRLVVPALNGSGKQAVEALRDATAGEDPRVASSTRAEESDDSRARRRHPGLRHLRGCALTGMHAQTLRQYDRLGLVSPGRTPGGGRRYSPRDIAALREIQGCRPRASAWRVCAESSSWRTRSCLRQRVGELQGEVDEHRAAARRTSLVVWRPPHRTR